MDTKSLDGRLAVRVREAAELCGVSTVTVNRWIRLGILTATRVEPEGLPLIEIEELRRVLRGKIAELDPHVERDRERQGRHAPMRRSGAGTGGVHLAATRIHACRARRASRPGGSLWTATKS
jgi:hypothetical protein